MPPVNSQSKNHLAFVDSIRALAAVYVVMHHAVLQYYGPTNTIKDLSGYNLTGFKKILAVCFYQGHYAVALFIVLSGYSLMLSVTKNNHVLKNGILSFFKRRIIRILPPYYLAMLLSIILIEAFVTNKPDMLWDSNLQFSYIDILTHLLLIHDFFSSTIYHINSVFWSISVEFRIYFFFPLLVWLWRKAGPVYTFLVSLIISITGTVILLYVKQYYPEVLINNPGVSPYIVLFTLGMMAADFSFSDSKVASSVRIYYQKTSSLKVIISVLLYLIVCMMVRRATENIHGFLHEVDMSSKLFDILISVFFSFILFICVVPKTINAPPLRLTKILSWKPLVFVGTFSYSIYLFHAPVIPIIANYLLLPLKLNKYITMLLLLTSGTALIVTLSYIFFYFFERPFLTLGKKTKQTDIEAAVIKEPAP